MRSFLGTLPHQAALWSLSRSSRRTWYLGSMKALSSYSSQAPTSLLLLLSVFIAESSWSPEAPRLRPGFLPKEKTSIQGGPRRNSRPSDRRQAKNAKPSQAATRVPCACKPLQASQAVTRVPCACKPLQTSQLPVARAACVCKLLQASQAVTGQPNRYGVRRLQKRAGCSCHSPCGRGGNGSTTWPSCS